MNSPVKIVAKGVVSVCVALLASGNVAAEKMSPNNIQAPVMKIADIGFDAVGKRKAVIAATQERIANSKHPRICPVLTDSELEAFVISSKDALALRTRYGNKSMESSTLGEYTNMTVMRDCEKQAKRILFFWDDHSYEAVKKRYDN